MNHIETSGIETSRINPDDFKRLPPIPEEGIQRATAIMRTGQLFRYHGDGPEDSEVALLERDFAAYMGVRSALALSSCTQAIELALMACGVRAGSKVLVPGFTFTAVPSAIMMLGAQPVFVECNEDLRLDVDDLERKITPDTRVLLLSHMRGYISDMDAIVSACDAHSVTLIEDAAHALGVHWRARKIGSFGKAGCFSFQSNKIINGGEGGMLTSDDEEVMVRAIYLSGAYEQNYRKHFASTSPLFEELAGHLPAHNVRMSNLTAAVVRPQIALLEARGSRYRQMHAWLRHELTATGRVSFPAEHAYETRVPDSLQFRVLGYDDDQMQRFVEYARECGLPLSRFATANNARAFYNWRYLGEHMPDLPQTRRAIENVCDMRLSAMLEEHHLAYVVDTVRAALDQVDRNTRSAAAR